MATYEPIWIKPLFQRTYGVAHQVSGTTCVQLHVIPLRQDMINVFQWLPVKPIRASYPDVSLVQRWFDPLLKGGHQGLQLGEALVRIACVQSRLRSTDGVAQTFEFKRLGEIVGGVQFKCLNGVLSEGGDEDHFRDGVGRAQAHRHFETVKARHLDVQDDDLGSERSNKLEGFFS